MLADKRHQYETQLAAVKCEVTGALQALRDEASKLGLAGGGDVAAADSTGALYDRLARLDRQVVWTRHAWQFFGSRFDQRDDSRLGAALRAADEVSWSCFKPLFADSTHRPPAPLPCIELDYTPSTLLSSHAHALRRLEEDEGGPLKGYFDSLPIPLLRLPPSVVTCPWMLAIIAHEVGHVVFKHVELGGNFPEQFSDAVELAAQKAGGDALAWRSWSTEIFADWYAVLMIGPAAVWSLAYLDRGSAAAMDEPRPMYPPANVRLILLALMAGHAGLKDSWSAFDPLQIDSAKLRAQVLAGGQAGVAGKVSSLVNMELPGRGETLAEAVSFRAKDFEASGAGVRSDVEQWQLALLGELQKANESDLRTARLVAAGTVGAAREIEKRNGGKEEQDKTKRELQQQKAGNAIRELCDTAFNRIVACAVPDTRAAATKRVEVTHRSLASRLFDASKEELFNPEPLVPANQQQPGHEASPT